MQSGRLAFNLSLERIAHRRERSLVEHLPCRLGFTASHDGENARKLLGSHHRDAVVGPREHEAWIVRAPTHAVVASTVRRTNHEREVGHRRVRHGVDQLRAVLDDATLLIASAHHEAGDVLHEEQRNVVPVAQLNELRALLGLLTEEDAVVGQDAERVAGEVGEARDECGTIQRLELLELAAVDHACDHITHLEGHTHVGAGDAEQLLGIEHRVDRRARRRGA